MQYSIFQITLSNEEIDEINSSKNPYKTHPKYKAICDSRTGGVAGDAWNEKMYTNVAKIEAEHLDEVFQIGNIGPDSAISRIESMHSISVGDVIVTPDGATYAVAPYGFTEIETA